MTKSSYHYHSHTSYVRHKMTGHTLDWQNQPGIYKAYPNIEPLKLLRNIHPPEKGLFSVIKGRAVKDTPSVVDIDVISLIFLLTYSLTAKARHEGGEFYYRSVASAGALYPTEMYVALHGVKGIDNGLYHFSIAHHGLSLLRKGSLVALIEKVVQPTTDKSPVITFFTSVIFFRSAWKYHDRSYRYHLLDTGHLVENLTLALKALAFPFTLCYDFDDHELNRLLGLDEKKEVCLTVCRIPGKEHVREQRELELQELPETIRNASRSALEETVYPSIGETHTAGTTLILSPEDKPVMINELGVFSKTWIDVSPPEVLPETMPYAEVIFHRRSKRNFVRQSISHDCLMYLIHSLCAIDMETTPKTFDYTQCLGSGILIGNAEKLDPGFYILNTASSSIGMVASGLFMDRMARVCLNQEWLANAAVHFLFMTNLEVLDRTWGARGYRYAMMSAGRMGERLYVAATAMGLGCCGIGAFYDGEAAELLGLNNESRLLYLVGLGPVKSAR